MTRLSLLWAVVGLTSAAVLPRQNLPPNATSKDPFSLPNAQSVSVRSGQVAEICKNFNYGPDIVTPGGAFYPTGSYAEAMIDYDEVTLFSELGPWTNVTATEAAGAARAVALGGGLKTLDDYVKLHDGFPTSDPGGPFPGLLSNRSSDLLFSMERLSTAPFGLKRLKPTDSLPFKVDDSTARKIADLTLDELHFFGLLFYFDHRNLEKYPLIPGRYAAASDAYFFIHPSTGDFLPLAIRLNRGSNLVYTPKDTPTDWTFAKLAFNMNNLWYEQWLHLQMVHYVIDLVFSAAVRSLNPDHPVYGLLDRLAYQTFAVRLFAVSELLNVGGPIDKYFFSNGSTAGMYGKDLYFNGGAGDWLNTDFLTEVQNRGLVDSPYGPPLKHFPYYEDAKVINDAMHDFMTSYVHAYYPNDAAVENDSELRALVSESRSAQIINFPSKLCTRKDLVAFLRHFAHTVSVVHGVINTNELMHATATLPYHPTSFYKPLPTAKNLTDIVPFMPNLTQAAGQLALAAAFNRPWIAEGNSKGENRTLTHMFDLPEFLARANNATRKANEVFKNKMLAFSKVVRGRTFDDKGLSQGMPFIWSVLDPEAVPFYVTV